VSTVKSPQEKKRLSLDLDCRNIYGENPQASRRNIRAGKQRGHKVERQNAKAALGPVKGMPDEESAVEHELRARNLAIQARRKSFKKTPDLPLGEVLKRKQLKRKQVPGRRSLARSSWLGPPSTS
jgi:hypothetical protein